PLQPRHRRGRWLAPRGSSRRGGRRSRAGLPRATPPRSRLGSSSSRALPARSMQDSLPRPCPLPRPASPRASSRRSGHGEPVPLPLVPFSFRPRAVPLEPRAVAALGQAAVSLADRLLALHDEALEKLSGVAGRALLIAIGEPNMLPWADGVLYLGR